MQNQINITLQAGEFVQDLRIPLNITVSHLMKELCTVFPRIQTDKRMILLVHDKELVMQEEDILSEPPLSNGDKIEVLLGE